MNRPLDHLPGEWRHDAACNPLTADRYYPEQGGREPAAKAVCGRCYVTAECLAYALEHHERYGTWGGKSSRERRGMSAP